MTLLQFRYNGDTYRDLQNDKFKDEADRARAVSYLLNDYHYSCMILRENLWKTKEEQSRAIHKTLRNSQTSFSALTVNEIRKQLDKNEIQAAIWVTIESPHYAGQLLLAFDGMNEKQHLQALETVLLDSNETLRFLNEPTMKEADRVYLMERVLDNTDMLQSIIKNNKDKKEKLNDKARKMMFDKLFQVHGSGYFYNLASENFLLKHELEQVYEKYHEKYHEGFKLKFYQYQQFCETFEPWLEDDYRRRMAQKIMTKTHWHNYGDVTRQIKFPQDVLDKFEAYKMAEKFRTAAS